MNAPNAQTETDQLGNNELLKEKPENTLLQEEPVSTPHVQNQSSNYRYSILSTVLTVAALAVGGYFSAMETVSYSLYQDAETASDAVKYRNETNANARKASISYGIAGGLLGVTILCYKFEL
jgi:hypothetical protein